jgi:competence protein ComGD
MKEQSGFTFIEMLLVFSIFLIIASVSIILIKPHYLNLEKEQFLSNLERDILYSQQYAMSHQRVIVFYIIPQERHYMAKDRFENRIIVERQIPKSILIEQGTLPFQFEFKADGVISRFGTVYFRLSDERYKITFQIGRGRFYVVKE